MSNELLIFTLNNNKSKTQMETQVSKLDQYLIDQRNNSISAFKTNVSETCFNRVMSVINLLESKGVKTEISPQFDRFDNSYKQTFIGFNKSGKQGSTWDWYKVIDFEFLKGDKIDYRGALWFDHSYSQLTGRTEKGTMWGIHNKNAYAKRFGVILGESVFY